MLNEVFKVQCNADPSLPGLKLKNVVIEDLLGNKHEGVLLRREDVANDGKFPFVDIELSTETQTVAIEYFLNKSESLHPEHMNNLKLHQTMRDNEARAVMNITMEDVVGAPSLAEVKANIELIEEERRRKEKLRQEQLLLADAAHQAGARGDVATQQALQLAAVSAAASTVISNSKFRNAPISTTSAPSATAYSSGAAPESATKKKRRMEEGKQAVVSAKRERSGTSVVASVARGGSSRCSRGGSVVGVDSLTVFALNAGAKNGSIAGGASVVAQPDEDEKMETLLPRIMGPKNYSPGREIRWALTFIYFASGGKLVGPQIGPQI